MARPVSAIFFASQHCEVILTPPGRMVRLRRNATGAPTQEPGWRVGSGRPPVHSFAKAINYRGLETCVREDLMDLLIERNQLRQ